MLTIILYGSYKPRTGALEVFSSRKESKKKAEPSGYEYGLYLSESLGWNLNPPSAREPWPSYLTF